MFNDSNGVAITGSHNTFNSMVQNTGNIDRGLQVLYQHAAPEALHDSGERFDPPNCHPETRVQVREEIMSWLNNRKSDALPVMWMNGPMGAGKSSIGQAIAEFCHTQGQLSGSFFFSRTNSKRNTEKPLVATLAYQLSKLKANIRPYISAAILDDPLIFESSLKSQIEALIIGPHYHLVGAPPSKSQIIVIDGLDECINTDAQAVIVKAFVSSIVSHRVALAASLKILIISRPETNIKETFSKAVPSLFVKDLSLGKMWLPADDIRRFLIDGFKHMRNSHPARTSLPPHWPSTFDIEALVHHSSGQFIYASVVMRFLTSHRNHPVKSLKIILGHVKDAKSRPYVELDALYTHIFSQVDDLRLVLRILCLHLLRTGLMTCSQIETVLKLPEGMVMIALKDIVSVLSCDQGRITFQHASLSEFLLDQSRSGCFYVNSDEVCADIAGYWVALVDKLGFLWISWSNRFVMDIFFPLMKCSGQQAHNLLCEAVSNKDIMSDIDHTWKQKGSIHYTEYVSDHGFYRFFKWILDQRRNPTTNFVFCSVMNNISKWILQQFKAFPFNGFDNADGIDFWIFPMIFRGPMSQFWNSDFISSILADCSVPSRKAAVEGCCTILRLLPADLLSNFEVLGEYSVTETRCLYAASRVFKSFLKLDPKDKDEFISTLINGEDHDLCRLLDRTPASKDLFKILKSTVTKCAKAQKSHWKLSQSEEIQTLHDYMSQGNPKPSPLFFTDIMCRKMAILFFGYMEKTRKEIPDIDATVEEELIWS